MGGVSSAAIHFQLRTQHPANPIRSGQSQKGLLRRGGWVDRIQATSSADSKTNTNGLSAEISRLVYGL